MKITQLFVVVVVCSLAISFASSLTFAEDAKPIRALLITGGCCHDYEQQKKILTEGVSARANVEWEIAIEYPADNVTPKIYQNKDWIKGFDVIVHNECYAKHTDPKLVDAVVKAHLDAGVGVVMVHCAMHTFRAAKTKEWDKLVGVESTRHGAKFPIVLKKTDQDHPITRDFPDGHKTPQGELYHTAPLAGATTLLQGFREGEAAKTTQACVWISTYEKTRTFGITLGHHNETMQEPEYLDMFTRGLLWSCKKLDENGKPMAGYEAQK